MARRLTLSSLSVPRLILAPLIACSSPSADGVGAGGAQTIGGGQHGGKGGTAGASEDDGLPGDVGGGGGFAGAPSGGTATRGGTGGELSGAAGAGLGGALGGSSGAAGSGGAAGSSGAAGSGGAAGSSGGVPTRQWSCPEGPFAEQMEGASTMVCAGFAYNYGYNEGPTWIAADGAFFFTNFIQRSSEGGDIIKYSPGGSCEVWLHDVGCNGLAVSASGNLLAACHGPRAVMEYDVKTKQARTIATMAGGGMLDSPNDLVQRSDGNIYFSNTTYELGDRPPGIGFALVRIDPRGATSVIEMGRLNGIALSPDENELHVVQLGTWALDAAGVPLQKGDPTPNGDGIAVDCAGRITSMGTNSAYGGADGKTLLVVGPGTSARTIQMSVPGLP